MFSLLNCNPGAHADCAHCLDVSRDLAAAASSTATAGCPPAAARSTTQTSNAAEFRFTNGCPSFSQVLDLSSLESPHTPSSKSMEKVS